MGRRILIIDGHPDARAERYIHALAQAYREGAEQAGHEVRQIRISELNFPLLRRSEDFENGMPPPVIRRCQEAIAWADHVLILFPLWLGSMPAALKAFFEQTLRPGFAFAAARGGGVPKKLLGGKSAHVVVTMGMPALFYRWYFRAHSLKSLARNILGFVGIAPIRQSLIGMVATGDSKAREQWLIRMRTFGAKAR
jgi:putative NADPH-quinone reductase